MGMAMDKKKIDGVVARAFIAVVLFAISLASAHAQGPVAAYSFDQGSGSTLTDVSGNGNTGSISGASWTSSGRYGSALSFDGTNDLVTIADASSLDLTTGMTLEAWVYPSASSSWRTVVLKEIVNDLSYGLYLNSDDPPYPAGYIRIGSTTYGAFGSTTAPLNTWTHVGLTYDGSVLRAYMNGVEVGSQSVSGSIVTSAEPVRIGGGTVWGEYFNGRIDEVRIYNRALSVCGCELHDVHPDRHSRCHDV